MRAAGIKIVVAGFKGLPDGVKIPAINSKK
jgi:hypothetical protein